MKRSFRRSDIKPDPARDVSDELRFHLEMRTQEFIDQGMAPDDAREAALAAFGDVTGVAAELREQRTGRARERQRRDWRRGVTMDVTYALTTSARRTRESTSSSRHSPPPSRCWRATSPRAARRA
jgi:hypothetical protein